MSDDGEGPKDVDAEHALDAADLNYPTLSFDAGGIEPDGSFDLSRELDYEEMGDWASGVAGALGSHDLGVTTPDGFLTFGVAPEGVDATFDADENNRGTLELTFRLSAKAMFVADDSETVVGSRGGQGFVPLSMLTDDQALYRCYNWVDDPEDPE